MRRSGLVFVLGLTLISCSHQPPNLFDSPNLAEGKTYRYRVPISGCARPIVVVNGRRWEPDTPWSRIPPTDAWKTTKEGTGSHYETYLVGTVRLEGDRMIIGLPDGTVVNRYHPTNQRQAFCA
jgi:hypothetical protein